MTGPRRPTPAAAARVAPARIPGVPAPASPCPRDGTGTPCRRTSPARNAAARTFAGAGTFSNGPWVTARRNAFAAVDSDT